MTKKEPVDFLAGLRAVEAREGIQRHPPAASTTTTSAESQVASPAQRAPRRQNSPRGAAITIWVDPVVRKQLAQLALDHDTSQAALVAEALNLLFERYGKPPIASP